MKMLLNDKRYADAERASEDEKYREQFWDLVNDKLKNHLQCVKSSQLYQKLIDYVLELEQKEGQINMCNALEELRQEETVNYIKNTDKRKSLSLRARV